MSYKHSVLAGTFFLVLAHAEIAYAQPSAELTAIRQEFQKCSAQQKLDPRAKCFETVAEQALDLVSRLAANPAKTAEDLAQEREAQGKREAAERYNGFIALTKAALTKNFKDPSSAKWRGLFIASSNEDGRLPFLCGEVNAKNSYGAYIGFKRFFISETLPGKIEVEDELKNFMFKTWYPISCKVRLYEVPES